MRAQDTQLVDRLYAVALEPEQLPELLTLLLGRAELLTTGGDLLERHFVRAAQMMHALQEAPERARGAGDAQPLLSVDRAGIVCDFNHAAERAYRLSSGCSVDVLPLDASGRRRLRALLEGGQATVGQPLHLLQVMRSDVARPMLISIEPHHSRAALYQLRTADIVWHARLEPLLAASFELTGSEVDIARRVFLGESITQIAQSRDTTVATVRTQVRAVYQKTGAVGQTDVIRLMSALAALYPLMPEDPQNGWHASAAADGAGIGLHSIGVESAPCCLMLEDEFHLAAVPLALQQAARDGMLRLLVARRGVSPTDSAKQVAALLQSLGIQRCAVLALGRGAVTAQMLAVLDPSRVSHLVLAAPVLPGAFAEAYTGSLLPFESLLRVAARGSPGLLDFLTAAALLTESRLGTAAMLGLVSTAGQSERAVSQMCGLPSPPAQDRAARFAADVRATEAADWEAFRGSGVPVRVLLGGADPIGAALAGRWLDENGIASLETVAGADALLGYTHGAALLQALLEA